MQEPEHVVNIIHILHETGAILPEPNAMEIERMISEEVEDECQIAEGPILNHAHRLCFMQCQTVADIDDEGQFLSKAEDLSSMAATAFEFVEANKKLLEVGTTRFESRDESMQEILDYSAHFVTASSRINNVEHILKDLD